MNIIWQTTKDTLLIWLPSIFGVLDFEGFFQKFYSDFEIEQEWFIWISILIIVIFSVVIIFLKNCKIKNLNTAIEEKGKKIDKKSEEIKDLKMKMKILEMKEKKNEPVVNINNNNGAMNFYSSLSSGNIEDIIKETK